MHASTFWTLPILHACAPLLNDLQCNRAWQDFHLHNAEVPAAAKLGRAWPRIGAADDDLGGRPGLAIGRVTNADALPGASLRVAAVLQMAPSLRWLAVRHAYIEGLPMASSPPHDIRNQTLKWSSPCTKPTMLPPSTGNTAMIHVPPECQHEWLQRQSRMAWFEEQLSNCSWSSGYGVSPSVK